MNGYLLAIGLFVTGLLAQSYAAGLSIEMFLRREQARSERRMWLALAIASLLLALQHGYGLELALRTSLYDLRQAMLGGGAALLYALVVFRLRREA